MESGLSINREPCRNPPHFKTMYEIWKNTGLSLYAERLLGSTWYQSYNVFGMTGPGIEPTTSRSRGERSTTEPTLQHVRITTGRSVKLILGQASVLQDSWTKLSPLQSSPPFAGAGLLHSLVLDLLPPSHVTEQASQCDHVDQWPSTWNNSENMSLNYKNNFITSSKWQNTYLTNICC